MATIQKLSAEMIGQIAAGEVVERPASAVKELVENSIDAGAKNITVELRDGGISYFRITDNGCGIPPEQIRLAFERHATSKIVRPEDLFDLHTLGFRGEALASVAAVARVTMVTRTADRPFGTKAIVENGEFLTIEETASPIGTSLTVEHLFQNVPARLKFLKKPQAEASYVADYLSRLILSRPDISFRFVNQGKTMYRSPGDGKTESAVLSLMDRETVSKLHRVEGSANGVLLRGYVGVGEAARGNRSQQSFFVNGRYFRNGLLSHALEEACKGRVMVGKFPICVLYLDLNPHSVDVNVHPNKLEVRFQNENGVYDAVRVLVEEALSREALQNVFSPRGTNPIASMPSEKKTTVEVLASQEKAVSTKEEMNPVRQEVLAEPKPVQESIPQIPLLPPKPVSYVSAANNTAPMNTPNPIREQAFSYRAGRTEAFSAPTVMKEKAVPYIVSVPLPPKEDKPASLEVKAEQLELPQEEPIKYIGSAFSTYMIFEHKERLFIVDQHAAHERILYDKYLSLLEKGKASQVLLTPLMVPLSAQEMLMLHELLPVLTESGFDVSVFDEKNVALRAVPMLYGVNAPPKELLMDALDEWDGMKKEITLDRMRRRMAQMACKHAIKGGDRLSNEQVKAFLDMCLESDSIPNCPHGRPIAIEVTRNEMEKRFSRIQK